MKPVPNRFNHPQEEEVVVGLWDEIDAFGESLKRSEGKPKYTFYDGPPFATGLPHYGHILAGTIKDTVTRYAHMTGHHVERRFGWDCHGLPIEFEIDKQYGIKTKDEVLEMGIGNYNEACRSIVMKYASEWKTIITRLGRWIDFDNDYKTMDINFMESVWWVFKSLHEKGLVYRGFKVMPYSTSCTTPISNFEANQNYKEVIDPAVMITFPIVGDEDGTSFVAWTTTPWTLPSNLALCVNPKMEYVKIRDEKRDAFFIVMGARLSALYKKENMYEIVETMLGEELAGKKYVPLFNYYADEFPGAFTVLADNYVDDSSGTGVVHMAPGFGEDDFRVCTRENIVNSRNVPCPVDENGRFTDVVEDFKGVYVKDADKSISRNIKKRNRLFNQGTVKHNYPFCWRSDTPLIYRTIPSWFIEVSTLNDRLLENNANTYWVPNNVKEKRFHNWLANARDWAVSRNRYWGTPLPIWISDDLEEMVVIGSVAELEELTGEKVTDLHRHNIDHLTIPSKEGRGELKRVPEVFDCWFESGSMPYAQQHYPFENKEEFEQNLFPADFIAEGLDQTRGWFYTLLVLSTALFDKPPFKNLIVNGMVLAENGKKMSKRLKNYPDPMNVVNEFGADSLRLYLINSPVVRAEKLEFSTDGIQGIIRDVFSRWFNGYRFLVQNVARIEVEGRKFSLDLDVGSKTENIMDKWVLSSLQSLLAFVKVEMQHYRLYTVVPKLVNFIDQLTNWYIRLNRDRIKGKLGEQDEQYSLSTLYQVLITLCTAMAPFTPFFTESLYQNLRLLLPADEQEDSVHFLPYPEPNEDLVNEDIELSVSRMQSVVELVRASRDRANVPIKYPLRQVLVYIDDESYAESVQLLEPYILKELNIKEVNFVVEDTSSSIKLVISLNSKVLGPRLRRDIGKVKKASFQLTQEELRTIESQEYWEVEGHLLQGDDYSLSREYTGDTSRYEPSWSSDVLLLLDTQIDEDLDKEGVSRDIVNKIQRLRKRAGLIETDKDVSVYISIAEGEQRTLVLEAIAEHLEKMQARTGTTILSMDQFNEDAVLLDTETDTAKDLEVVLKLTRNA
eukprot:TRINITY_DN667_c0_g2_i1.p1 TRINITY_DN667_c0_g2~~TRINITY_DN667_c0_g2_i1.p1  ORF type:complete len:1069 (+),score=302.23 TRINITY_DN667_c0_g2_i1:19-3225(+)